MKKFLTALAGCLFIFSSASMATEGLRVTLSDSTDPATMGQGKLTFTITNTGDTPVRFLRFNTPFVQGGHLPGPIFQITWNDTNYPTCCQVIRYHGGRSSFGTINQASFTRLAPGESKSTVFDASESYELVSGKQHFIKYAIPSLEVITDDVAANDPDLAQPHAAHLLTVETDTLTFTYTASAASATAASQIFHNETNFTKATAFTNTGDDDPGAACTSSQVASLAPALDGALELSSSAASGIFAFYESGFLDKTVPTYPIYTKWFGEYAGFNIDSQGRYYTPRDSFDYDGPDGNILGVAQALNIAFLTNNRAQFAFTCGCRPSYDSDPNARTQAWAEEYSINSRSIHLCDDFWRHTDRGDVKSRAATLLHEASHLTWGLLAPDNTEYVTTPTTDPNYVDGTSSDMTANGSKAGAMSAHNFELYALDMARYYKLAGW